MFTLAQDTYWSEEVLQVACITKIKFLTYFPANRYLTYGMNDQNQLGNALNPGASAFQPVPGQVQGLDGAPIVGGAGAFSNVVTIRNNNSIFYWGTLTPTKTFALPQAIAVPGGENWAPVEVAVMSGFDTYWFAAISFRNRQSTGWAIGTIYVGNFGSAGLGNTNCTTNTPNVAFCWADLTNFNGTKITSIVSGRNFVLFLDDLHQLWGFGSKCASIRPKLFKTDLNYLEIVTTVSWYRLEQQVEHKWSNQFEWMPWTMSSEI